ncbi:hypothetical protein AR457_27990 [Streptomyces agglomeratus]|uniref:Uncharacterized protein n=1 Tax=Streptomyces agglomeratus TaxID=285458 RepID=A0A1E5PJL9_9ACTN|nr:hypothetical protein [Streptomyces agglomeratus]OEJ29753.1 hypothetical protein AS594_27870 [Streptomyces agglomeratus]OEJ42229.1 hypothetical protein BGK70_08665 [Streptomyces agglomeratus]OEJ49263.1 hypothetical protein AR457_27990 [Streptomyces agglomeratus]OEJ55543.1 hypothetical protein BGK72_08140 [Streptomyces agglomeratus]OEJ62923.1 hypothetical protein BGM19_09010 [Streptomyces agglomeratus]
MAVLAAVSAVGMAVDDRVLAGSAIWFKPLKFSVSLLMYAMTLAWMLSLATRGRRVGWWAGTVVAVTGAIEMAVIVGQVVRGRRSHFNYATAFDALLFNVMAVTIVTLWIGSLVIAVLLFRSRLADRASAWAVRLGAVIALIGAALGNLMTQPTPEQQAAGGRGVSDVVGAHSVGVPDGGPSMPLTGWSTTGGDLRIPHFVGMHALQLIPLFLLVLVALAPRLRRLRDARVRLRLVLVASASYAAVLALVTWQALRGQALIHPDGATLTAAAVIVAGSFAGTLVSLRTTPSREAPEPVPDTTTKELAA